MKPAPFEYFRPETIDEAVALLDRHGDGARLIAGGQSLVPTMNLRLAAPDVLIDISRMPQLHGWKKIDDDIHIGAAMTQAALIRDQALAGQLPLLAAALPNIGHVQTRSRGTIGGSLAHADPSAEIGLVAATLDAIFVLRSARGERRLSVNEFQLGALTTAIEADEILVEVVMRCAPPGARCVFRELARRHGDFALVAVAAQIAGADLRIAVGGLEAQPRRCGTLAATLTETGFSPEAIERAIRRELDDVDPLSDIHASGGYRVELAAALMAECLAEILS